MVDHLVDDGHGSYRVIIYFQTSTSVLEIMVSTGSAAVFPPKKEHHIAMTNDGFRNWGIGQVYPGEVKQPIMAMDFFRPSGEVFVTSRLDGEITLVNAVSGEVIKTLYSKEFGADKIKFSHSRDAVIYSSNNRQLDHSLRYHSLYDNVYLRYFQGHTQRVTSLMMHPVEDQFITSSLDGTVRLWSLNVRYMYAISTSYRVDAESEHHHER